MKVQTNAQNLSKVLVHLPPQILCLSSSSVYYFSPLAQAVPLLFHKFLLKAAHVLKSFLGSSSNHDEVITAELQKAKSDARLTAL